MEIKKSSSLGEKYIYRKLESGLDVYIVPKPGYTKKFALFGTKYGSLNNSFEIDGNRVDAPEGIAHFLEHKLFESEEGGVFKKYSKLGASVNAYTNFNSTCYLFTCADNFQENLEILIDFVQNPYLTKENVEKEKGIIEQEIRMYDDDPNWRVFFNGLRKVYNEHPVRIDIAGTVESIYKINKETLELCYNSFYNANNMVVIVVGDVDIDKTFDTIDMGQTERFKESKDVIRILESEKSPISEHRVEQKLSVSTPLFNIIYKNTSKTMKGKALLKEDIETRLILDILFGNSSEFFSRLYEKGLINDSFEYGYTYDTTYGHTVIGGESKEPDEVYRLVKEEVKKIISTGFDEETFTRIKKKTKGEFISSFNSVDFIANTFASYYFKDINLFDYIDVLDDTTHEDLVNRLKNHFTELNSVLSVIVPS